MWRKFLIIMPLISTLALACGSKPVADTEMTALDAQVDTALIEGCGQQLIPGYLYCLKREGESTEDLLWFVGPLAKCKRAFCVEFKVFPQDGGVPVGGSIPKGSQRVSLPWSSLVKRANFELADRGFWPFTYTVYWDDDAGNENISKSQGEIRLRVFPKAYIPLNEVTQDKNFAWSWIAKGGETVKMTTGMRTYVSKRPEVKNGKAGTNR